METNLSRIVPNILKTKIKLHQLFDNGKKNDLETRLRSCHLQINKEKKGINTDTSERYVKAMIWNIRVC